MSAAARRALLTLLSLAAFAAAEALLSFKTGPVPISWDELVRVVADPGAREALPAPSRILLDLRLPRVLLGLLVGAALAVSGTTFQALLRNPVADPYLLGLSGGAALGAVLALVSGAAQAAPLLLGCS